MCPIADSSIASIDASCRLRCSKDLEADTVTVPSADKERVWPSQNLQPRAPPDRAKGACTGIEARFTREVATAAVRPNGRRTVACGAGPASHKRREKAGTASTPYGRGQLLCRPICISGARPWRSKITSAAVETGRSPHPLAAFRRQYAPAARTGNVYASGLPAALISTSLISSSSKITAIAVGGRPIHSCAQARLISRNTRSSDG